MGTKNSKKYKCPYCDYRNFRSDLIDHVDEEHEDMIPKDYTSTRIVYNAINKKDHGSCMICHRETKWDEDKERYNTLCENPKCKKEYVEIVRSRMVKKYGTHNLLKDPNFQKKMLENRSISGKYKFEDGGSVGYVGSYEKKFLEFMDKFLHIKSYDIISPGPNIPYMYKGKEHVWITDYIYEPYNLVFDIKDGGDNPNTRDMKEYREKQIAKEKAIAEYGDYNYIRLTNNNFEQLISVFMELKEKVDEKPLIRINESYVEEGIGMVLKTLKNIITSLPTISESLEKIKTNTARRLNMINSKLYLTSFKKLVFNPSNVRKYMSQNKTLQNYYSLASFENVYGFIYADNDEFVASISVVEYNNDVYIDSIIINDDYVSYGLLGQLIDVAMLDLGATVVNVSDDDKTKIEVYEKCGFIKSNKVDESVLKMVNNRISNSSKRKSPVFIVASYNDSSLSHAIVAITDSYHSHVSISLDPQLKSLYSFGSDKLRFKGSVDGFQPEQLKVYKDKKSFIQVNCIFLDDAKYKKLYNEIEKLSKEKTSYNFAGLIDVANNKVRDTDGHNMICSEFVYYLLVSAGVELFDKPANLVTPDDLARLCDNNNKVYKLYEGTAENYDSRLVESRLRNIQKKAYIIDESFID